MLNNNSNSYRGVYNSPLIVPCEYVEIKTIDRPRAFEVKLFSLVLQDDENLTTYSFLHYSDYIFNADLVRETGYKCTLVFSKIIVTKRSFSWLYDKIISYENVLKSHSNSE